jgi:NAD(P)H-nitrite reductase large subunit
MTIILPYNSKKSKEIKIFPKKYTTNDIIDFVIKKHNKVICRAQITNESTNTRFYIFRITTYIKSENEFNNIPIEDEGWYDWIMEYNNIKIDEGQLYINEDSNTKKIFYL